MINGHAQSLFSSRHPIAEDLSAGEAKTLAADPKIGILQICRPLPRKTFELLEKHVFSVRKDISFRAYGFYDGGCDLDFLRALPSLTRLDVDCLRRVENLDAVSTLKHLREFGLGVFELDSLAILDALPRELTSLSIHATRSKKPDLASLGRFEGLKHLYVEGHEKGIAAAAGLKRLETLTLRSVTLPSLDFLAGLEKLWSVDIKLGGTRNLKALERLKSLSYLQLWLVRGLADLSVLAGLKNLELLFLQALKQVTRLPSLKGLKKLRRVHLEGMKGLLDFQALADAPSLRQLTVSDMGPLDPEQFRCLVGHPGLRECWIGLGSAKKRAVLEAMLPFPRPEPFFHDRLFTERSFR